MPVNHQTAILLFSRSAEAEARAKSFGAGEVGNLRIAESLLRRTESTIATAGLPIVRVDEKKQRGRGFGAKLSAALSDAFALGYTNLIVVGNDAPTLRAGHLRLAAQTLARGENLVVPDKRGGISLLGIKKVDFQASSFGRLGWETDRLFDDLTEALPGAVVLAPVGDINGLGDLRAAWRYVRGRLSGVYSLLWQSVLAVVSNLFSAVSYRSDMYGRGPPLVD